MVKLKKKSRRQKLSQKYTIEKKVREHRRAMRKAAKQRDGPIRRKHRKDPGIPNSFPFKKELLLTIQARKRQQAAARQEALQAKRGATDTAAAAATAAGAASAAGAAPAAAGVGAPEKTLSSTGSLGGENTAAAAVTAAAENARGCDGLEKLAASALERAAAYYDSTSSSAAGGERQEGDGGAGGSSLWGVDVFASGRMQHVLEQQQRQQQQELRRVLQQADVIIEVLDARMPEAFRCLGLERAVIAAGKKLVLLLNKIDLVPVAAGIAWLQYLQQHAAAPVLAMKCPRSAAAAKRFAARRPHICSSSKRSAAAAASAAGTAAAAAGEGGTPHNNREEEEKEKKGAAHRGNLLPLFSDGKDSLRRSAAQVLGADALLRLLHSMAYGGSDSTDAAAAPAAPAPAAAAVDLPLCESSSSSDSASSSSRKHRSSLRKKNLVVGVVGYPNAGKSSLINVLKGSGSAAGVAALPGSTKVAQVVKLDKHISLVDTPGVLFRPSAVDSAVIKSSNSSSSWSSSSSTASTSSSNVGAHGIGAEGMEVDDTAAAATADAAAAAKAKAAQEEEFCGAEEVSPFLLQSLLPLSRLENAVEVATAVAACCCKETLQRVYRISAAFESPQQLLAAVAHSRGKLKKGGVPDLEAAARLFLQDWQKGTIPYYTLPPSTTCDKNVNLEKEITWNTSEHQQQQCEAKMDGGAAAEEGEGAAAADAGDAAVVYKELLQWQCAGLAAEEQGLGCSSNSNGTAEVSMNDSSSNNVMHSDGLSSASRLQQQQLHQEGNKRFMLLRFGKGSPSGAAAAAAGGGRGGGEGESPCPSEKQQKQKPNSEHVSRAVMQHVAVKKKLKEAMKKKRKTAAREAVKARNNGEISVDM